MATTAAISGLKRALPFWLSLAMAPFPIIGALYGGWAIALTPVVAWYAMSVIDQITGLNAENPSTETEVADLFWYRLITWLWVPVQFALIYGLIGYVAGAEHLSTGEKIGVMASQGVLSRTIGIVYAHELVHQRNKFERTLGDLLLAMVLYSHFRSEHLLVHHRYVGTPRDPASARYNENFHRFFIRVLVTSLPSAFKAETALLARKDKAWWDRANPFWRYLLLQLAMIGLSVAVAGWFGILLFFAQAYIAILALELTNYVEHYGLTRRHLGNGRYEHVQPHHSWNASHKATNWLLINLQRHSDHHYKPDRRFPLLQTYGEDEAPQLPYGYPVMAMAALVPPLWRRWMNPKVRAWRAKYYPDITDWSDYKTGSTPMPR